MYPISRIWTDENYSNSEYRKEATKIIESASDPISEIAELADKEGTPTAYINTAIPLIRAIQNRTLGKKNIPAANEYLKRVDQILFYYPIAESHTCTPFYFEANKLQLLVNKYLWPNIVTQEPMYFFLPRILVFKERLDKFLEDYTNEYARYKYLMNLRRRAKNSIGYLDNKVEELNKFYPYLQKYSSTVKSSNSRAGDILYIVESTLSPLISKTVADLKGNLKGILPTWELSWKQLEALYNKLKGEYIDSTGPKEAFLNLFKGKDIITFQSRIIWVDINPKNKIPTSSTILKLFKILAYYDCIDRRYASKGGRVRDIAHRCFLVDGKAPEKRTMRTAWSNITGTSAKFKDLEKIVQSIASIRPK
jgi:hypothetical protein